MATIVQNKAVIGVGANLNPRVNINRAKELIMICHDLLGSSHFEETTPIGPIQNQPNFLNGVWLIETKMSLDQLIQYLKSIEDVLGRDRTQSSHGPRPIDLDVVVWNREIIDADYHYRPFLKKMVDGLFG